MLKNEVHFPVETIRSAFSKLNKKHTSSNFRKTTALLAHEHDSGDSGDDSFAENKHLLLSKDVSTEDNVVCGLRECHEQDTESDVSDGIFSGQEEEDDKFDEILSSRQLPNSNISAPKLPKSEESTKPPKFVINNCPRKYDFESLKAKEEKEENKEDKQEDDCSSSFSKTSESKSDSFSTNKVILYQSVADGAIAVKSPDADDEYDDIGSYKENYSDNEILNGVSFRMKYLGSTPISSVKHQVDDVRSYQAQEAISTITGTTGHRPSNPVIFTISVSKLLVYDGKMQQVLMEHPIKFVSYAGDVGKFLVVMVRYENPIQKQVYRVTCHVFECPYSKQVRVALNKAFTLCYNDVINRAEHDEETLLQCAYSEVLGCQKRADEDISDLLDSTKHKLLNIIKRPQEGLGISLIPSGPGSIIPTVLVSSIRPSSPAYKTEQLNVGDQILEINKRSLCGLTYEESLDFVKSLLPTTNIEFKIVPGSPVLVIELIRPDLKYPLGFSVKDGHITTLIRGSIGERAGVRIGHRIIAINEESTVTSDHDTIAGILLSETGRLILKTMPSPIFNLMLGYETPVYI